MVINKILFSKQVMVRNSTAKQTSSLPTGNKRQSCLFQILHSEPGRDWPLPQCISSLLLMGVERAAIPLSRVVFFLIKLHFCRRSHLYNYQACHSLTVNVTAVARDRGLVPCNQSSVPKATGVWGAMNHHTPCLMNYKRSVVTRALELSSAHLSQ